MEVLGLVLEDLDELDHAAVADVERAVEVEDARIALAVQVELRDVLAADQHRGVLVVRVDRRDHADADAVPLRELAGDDRELLVAGAELLLQAEAADRAEVALDVHAEHLLEFLAQVAREKMERLLEHRAALDGVDGVGLLEAALQLLDQRALPRADRPHQVEHLAALLALQRRGVEVADDLADRLLDAEELVAEEVVDLERLVLVEPLHPRVLGLEDVLRAVSHHHVVETARGPASRARGPGEPVRGTRGTFRATASIRGRRGLRGSTARRRACPSTSAPLGSPCSQLLQGPARPAFPPAMVSAASYEAIVGTPSTLHGRSSVRTKQAVCRDGKVWARGEMTGPMPSIPCRVRRMTPSGELTVSLRCAAPDSHNHLRRAFGRSRVAPTRKAWARVPLGLPCCQVSSQLRALPRARRCTRATRTEEREVVPGGIEPPLPT